MKKRVISLIFIFLMIIMTSCTSHHKFDVVEVGGYNDNISGAVHSNDIDLENKEYQKLLKPDKTVTINGIDVQGKYTTSQKGYLFNSDVDYYESSEGGVNIQFGINNKTGRIDSYSYVSSEYAENKGDATRLTNDQCLNVATDYLNQYTDSDKYSLVSTNFLEIPEYEAVYDFEFVRIIDGMETSDKAYIGVSVFGDVISHIFNNFGEMKDASCPSSEDLKIIESNIDTKVKEIYDTVADNYSYSYDISEKVLVKLSDGKYAMEYYITVVLSHTNQSAADIKESVKLLVYI